VQIAREALSNVVRHSDAKRVTVSLSYEANRIRLTIGDDGVGLQAQRESSWSGNGHGLANIRSRVKVLAGDLTLESAPGGGTIVDVVIPCNADGEVC